MCPRGRPRGQGRPRGLHLWVYVCLECCRSFSKSIRSIGSSTATFSNQQCKCAIYSYTTGNEIACLGVQVLYVAGFFFS